MINIIFFKKGILHECNTMAAEYLFQSDKHYDIQYDTGDKVIQCGRHNDIFKFWLMWRAKVKLITNSYEFLSCSNSIIKQMTKHFQN